MVPKTHDVSDVADRDQNVIRRSSDLQQELVLLWLQARGSSRLFTELQKSPDFKAKLREKLDIAASRWCRCNVHSN